MKKQLLFSLIAVAMLIFTGCAHVHPITACLPTNETPSGFWFGVWNGLTMTFAFIGSLFDSDITVYDVNNNGNFYNFGFVGGFWFLTRFFINIIKGILS